MKNKIHLKYNHLKRKNNTETDMKIAAWDRFLKFHLSILKKYTFYSINFERKIQKTKVKLPLNELVLNILVITSD